MTKIVAAECTANVVTVDGKAIDAEILSQGTKASEGIVALDKAKAVYITSNAEDIKKVIEDVAALIQQVTIIATGLDAGTTSPGSQAAAIASLGVLKAQFELTKENLK